MNIHVTNLRLLVALMAVLSIVACVGPGNVPVGEMETESRAIKLGDAKSVRVEVQMGAGEMKLSGGAKDLLEADFSYNVPQWKPQVDYSVSGTRGQLTIRQPERSGGHLGYGRYNWDLRFNDKVPMEMSVNLGAGKSQLLLGTLSLTNLDLNTGVGETVVDLTGDWKNDLRARIRGGVGKATVRLPRDIGVRARARGGIGQIHTDDLRKDGDTYVNDALGKSAVTIDVTVEGGIGEIFLELGGAPPVV